MDGTRFDELARTVAKRSSRRRFLTGVVGAALGVAAGRGGQVALAGGATGAETFDLNDTNAICTPVGELCNADSECCERPDCALNRCVRCVNGGCNTMCRGAGGTCGADGDCCSGVCTGGICRCPSGTYNCNGRCLSSSATCNGCPAGYRNCNGRCVDTHSDRNNCGSCGTVCQKSQTCSFGTCCPVGTISCGGVCVPPIQCS
jgi:hypothetical protein